ncbi:MAG: hypothetical protein AB3N13_04280 [Arenibacterium sp.]
MRVAFALFVVLFVMSWQRMGPPDAGQLFTITGICLGFVIVIHSVLWSVEMLWRFTRWLAHWGRDRLPQDDSGVLVGRYTPLFRIVMPLSLVALSGALAGGPGMHLAIGTEGGTSQALFGMGLFLTAALILYAATYFMTFRYRMDSSGVRISKMFIAHSHHRWHDLKAIGTGPLAGDVVLVFANGQCARIPRYSEGHEMIADYALERMRHA